MEAAKNLAERYGLLLDRHFENTYSYVGRRFNGQRAVRCTFMVSRINQLVEASNYEQLADGIPIKVAIELSTMFGCPIKCAFCASGNLDTIHSLQANEIVGQGIVLADYYERTSDREVPKHFCFQGIGEPSLIPGRIVYAAHKLLGRYPTAKFKVSTMGANPDGVPKLAADIPWEAVQISFPHHDADKLRWLFRCARDYNPLRVLSGVHEFRRLRPDVRLKFNYIGIENFNDTPEDIKGTVSLLRSKGFLSDTECDRSELKISFLNPTDVMEASNLRGIGRTELERLLQYAQDKLGIKSAYVFGPMHDCTVGCGQLIANHA